MSTSRNDKLQQQLIRDLLVESSEGLDRFDRAMLVLEEGRADLDTLNDIFRIIHTIKGTSGCLGLTKIEAVAHVGENLLDALREGKIGSSPALVTALLAYADALREMLRSLEVTGGEGDADYSELLACLESLLVSSPPPTAAAPPPAFGFYDDEPAEETPAPEPAPPPIASEPPAAPERAAVPAIPAAAEREPARTPSASDSAIRVDVGQLDRLMNLVGELVLARNQIVQFTTEANDTALQNASQRLNIITTELQESVMKTRMQPIGNVWAKFPRVVRDVAHELGKQVQLVMEGSQTELDRTIIEAIKDPLTHLVRNAIDHGLEDPAARQAAEKPEQGLLILRAFHEGGQVNIEIMDDGRGINLPRVKQKAIERGIITAEQAGRLSEREAFSLIFHPGFSTAEKITNVSGRGVGMDVVKTNIEKIGGSVDVLSEAGKGTTIKLKIPLTLAIIPALIVTTAQERFAIPQVSLVELVRLDGETARKSIESLYGSPVYRLRGQLLPLACLDRVLDLADPGAESAEAINIVVLQADGRQFGLVVDQINDTEEIVVKPLGKQLKGLNCFAGATIMGDGRVALILDVLGLAQHARVISEVRDRSRLEQIRSEARDADRQTLLLFEAGADVRMAIPLSMVARLEEIPLSSVERSGRREVVQYRGQILPLVRVSDYLAHPSAAPAPDSGDLQVVVYSEGGRSLGLVVHRINDIVEESVTIRREATGDGILGSAVIQDRITDLLDVPAIIRRADPGFDAAQDAHAA